MIQPPYSLTRSHHSGTGISHGFHRKVSARLERKTYAPNKHNITQNTVDTTDRRLLLHSANRPSRNYHRNRFQRQEFELVPWMTHNQFNVWFQIAQVSAFLRSESTNTTSNGDLNHTKHGRHLNILSRSGTIYEMQLQTISSESKCAVNRTNQVIQNGVKHIG